MATVRQRRRKQKRRYDAAQEVVHRRHMCELEAQQQAALDRERKRRDARATLARLKLYGNLTQPMIDRLCKVTDALVSVALYALAPFMLALVLREVGIVDVVRHTAVFCAAINLTAVSIITACTPLIYVLTVREIIGQWLFEAAVGLGLVTYCVWPHVWLGATVLATTFVVGTCLAVWGVNYRARLTLAV